MTFNRKSPAAHFLLIVFFAFLVVPTAASSQVSDPSSGLEDPEVTLYLEGQMRSALRLAMPAMQGADRLSPEMIRAAQELERTLRADLQASGVFVPINTEDSALLFGSTIRNYYVVRQDKFPIKCLECLKCLK